MEENPYSSWLEMTNETETSIDFKKGKVVSISPFIIKMGDLQIDKDNDILITDNLSNRLNKGDELAIMQTSDKQNYIIIARLEGI